MKYKLLEYRIWIITNGACCWRQPYHFNFEYFEIMEELLNKLIKKWRKPFWRETKHELSSWVVYDTIDIKWKWDIRVIDRRHHHIRELVSKESWLRQFCCKNRFLKWPDSTDERQKNPIWASFDELFYASQYQFYLIECALKDESELEKFLLDNIKI